MQDIKKNCYSCRYYNRYYTRGVKEFHQTNFGFCFKKEKNIVGCKACENYEYRKPKKNQKNCAFV